MTKCKKNRGTPRRFDELLFSVPATPLLDSIKSPDDLKTLKSGERLTLCDELRAFLLYCVPTSGGHFGANLGTVELTVALHTVLNTPKDKLVWDVGHQAYAHKILTGRKDKMASIRARGGLTAFPERSESKYDAFGVGHSSTAISAGLGMSLAARLTGEDICVACVVGDGAMTGGMAFEAMNDAVEQNADLLVVLNDNDMSISQATGGFSKHLALLWQRGVAIDIDPTGKPVMVKRDLAHDDRRFRHYIGLAGGAIGDISSRLPAKIGEKLAGGAMTDTLAHLPDKLASKIGDNFFPDNLFRAIGFSYFGPFDGHDVDKLVQVFDRVKRLKGAVLVHVHTIKGKGFSLAEADPIGYHALAKLPKASPKLPKDKKDNKKYADVFGQFLLTKAKDDERLVAITPAMAEGSGMTAFAKAYPKRFFDVAIAEQHAVTLAAGMATHPNIKPIVAIYSTFLQRGYDQLIHDVALQNLDVTFAIDRAGLVGEDGATHAGVFDLAFIRCVPNMVIAAPSDENECFWLLNVCYEHKGPSAIRYPRGAGVGADIHQMPPKGFAIGQSRLAWRSDNWGGGGKKLAVLSFGTRLKDSVSASIRLADSQQLAVCVIDMRWVKPLDGAMLKGLLDDGVACFATVEEHQLMGGAGSAVNEWLMAQNATVVVKNIGIADSYIPHGSHSEQLAYAGIDEQGVFASLADFMSKNC